LAKTTNIWTNQSEGMDQYDCSGSQVEPDWFDANFWYAQVLVDQNIAKKLQDFCRAHE
jgi:hypothetical protein